jgi:ABC-type transporter Mla subunit MlaD
LIDISTGLDVEKISTLIKETSEIVINLNHLIEKNKSEIDQSLNNIDEISANLVDASISTKNIIQEVEIILNSDTIQTAIGNIAKISHTINKANLYQLINELKEAAVKANKIFGDIDIIVGDKRDNISNTIDKLEATIEALNSAAQKIDADPSILIGGSNPENPPDNNLE